MNKHVGFLRKHSPMILPILGVGGFALSMYLTAKATPRAIEVLDEVEESLPEDGVLRIFEQAKALVPVYAQTAGICLVSASLIFMGTTMSAHKYAALAAIYTLTERSMASWQERVRENVSNAAFDKINSDVAREEAYKTEPPEVIYTTDKVLCFDIISGRYFTIESMEKFRTIINELNENMYSDTYININDYYYAIDLPPVKYGNEIGWDIADGRLVPKYSSILTKDGRAAVTIDFENVYRHQAGLGGV